MNQVGTPRQAQQPGVIRKPLQIDPLDLDARPLNLAHPVVERRVGPAHQRDGSVVVVPTQRVAAVENQTTQVRFRTADFFRMADEEQSTRGICAGPHAMLTVGATTSVATDLG